MLSAFAKLFALRPILSMAILGVPVMTLIVIGFFALWFLKILFFLVLPVALVIWLVRKVMKKDKPVVVVSDL